MSLTYLQKRRPAAKQMRFYTIGVTQPLFGDWALIRDQGRIGQSGMVRETAGEVCEMVSVGRRTFFAYLATQREGWHTP